MRTNTLFTVLTLSMMIFGIGCQSAAPATPPPVQSVVETPQLTDVEQSQADALKAEFFQYLDLTSHPDWLIKGEKAEFERKLQSNPRLMLDMTDPIKSLEDEANFYDITIVGDHNNKAFQIKLFNRLREEFEQPLIDIVWKTPMEEKRKAVEAVLESFEINASYKPLYSSVVAFKSRGIYMAFNDNVIVIYIRKNSEFAGNAAFRAKLQQAVHK